MRVADLVGALSTEAVQGFRRRLSIPVLHELRPHPGQVTSAANLWRLMQGSEIRQSHRHDDDRVQDPYCHALHASSARPPCAICY